MLDSFFSANLLLVPIALLTLTLSWLLLNRFRQSQHDLTQAEEQIASLKNQNASLSAQGAELSAKLNTYIERVQWQQQQLDQSKLDTQALDAAKTQLTHEFERLSSKIFEDREQKFQTASKDMLQNALSPVASQLQAFKQRVDQAHDRESAERNSLIGKITELQNQTLKVGEDANNLARALKGDNKAQGNWGELILERLLEDSGLQKGREYSTQQSFNDADGKLKLPDFILHLPSQKDIIIDSKVSLLAYDSYCNANSSADEAKYTKALIASIRTHIQQLSKKNYEHLEGVHSLEFVFLFIPVEPAYFLALQQAPELCKEAFEQQVVLTSPTTLLASLKTVQSLWRSERQNKNAERIAREAGALYDQFVLFLTSLDELGRNLDKSCEAYSQARKRLSEGRGNLVKRTQDLQKLGAKTKKHIADELIEQAELSN